MKKLSWVLAIVIVIAILFTGYTANYILTARHRNFTYVEFKKYGICFVADDSYTVTRELDSVMYERGKNSGVISVLNQDVSPHYILKKMGEFELAYYKEKNTRIVQYKLPDGKVLQDSFIFRGKGQANLMAYKISCPVWLKRSSKSFIIE